MTIQVWHKAKAISQKGTGRTVYRKLLPGEKIPSWKPDAQYKNGHLSWRVGGKLVVYSFRGEVCDGHVRIPKLVTVVRYLKAGDVVPWSAPRKYLGSDGYVRLRWKVGLREYVEAREHQVVGGRIVHGVRHHKNGIRSDNRPENLQTYQTTAEHLAEHRKHDYDEIKNLYLKGMNTIQVAQKIGTCSGVVSRILKKVAVRARYGEGLKSNNRIKVDEGAIGAALEKAFWNVSKAVRLTGIPRHIIRRVQREMGFYRHGVMTTSPRPGSLA